MRTLTCLLLLLLVNFAIPGSSHSEYHYYSDNRAIPMNIDSGKVLILFDSSFSYDYADFKLNYPRIDTIHEYDAFNEFQMAKISTADSLENFLDSLAIDYRVDLANPYFIVDSTLPMLVGRTICCKFEYYVSHLYIDSLNLANDVEIIYENENYYNLFFLRVKCDATESTLEIANHYYELDETEFCHPNFLGGYEWNSYEINDHYWDEQWAMHRMFEVSPNSPDSLNHKAYEITQGDTSIVIAILDTGAEPHDDFSEDRYAEGYDFVKNDYDPTPCQFPWGNEAHGQCVAGIAGATHNRDSSLIGDRNTGVYGVAPQCRIMPLRIGTGFPWVVADSMFEDFPNCMGSPFVHSETLMVAIEWAWLTGADIISCSWGGRYPEDLIEWSLNHAAEYGRDGKGCGIFFSSGNTPSDTAHYPSDYESVISVASLHPDDSVWGYCTTSKVDVVAPSGPLSYTAPHGVWTTDLMDSAGYNHHLNDLECGDPDDDDYMCHFGGTSAAAPMAAGVAALVLSQRPDLTHDELHDVIRNSADPHLYEEITDPPHQKYGHGMVHPFRALLSVSRGDANNDGVIDLLDITYLYAYLYQSGPAPQPDVLMGDANCGCTGSACINILDITYIIDYLYNNGPPPSICFNYYD